MTEWEDELLGHDDELTENANQNYYQKFSSKICANEVYRKDTGNAKDTRFQMFEERQLIRDTKVRSLQRMSKVVC